MVSQSHHTTRPASHDLEQQRLRILRCTAHAMASSPGGLRFSPGTRPWLEGLTLVQPVVPASGGGGKRQPDVAKGPSAQNSKP